MSQCFQCSFNEIEGLSEENDALIKKLSELMGNTNVLFVKGEKGTGKAFISRILHFANCNSDRDLSFIRINCQNIDDLHSTIYKEIQLYHGEYFNKTKEIALLLTEIGFLDLISQNQLIQLIQNLNESNIKTLYLTSSMDLQSMAEENFFNYNLLELINENILEILPLRKRSNDIIPIALRIYKRLAYENGVKDYIVTLNALQEYINYPWPGNVSELKDYAVECVSELKHGQIEINQYPYLDEKKNRRKQKAEKKHKIVALELLEKDAIVKALEVCGGNQVIAAKRLGISRSTLYRKMKTFNIQIVDSNISS